MKIWNVLENSEVLKFSWNFLCFYFLWKIQNFWKFRKNSEWLKIYNSWNFLEKFWISENVNSQALIIENLKISWKFGNLFSRFQKNNSTVDDIYFNHRASYTEIMERQKALKSLETFLIENFDEDSQLHLYGNLGFITFLQNECFTKK